MRKAWKSALWAVILVLCCVSTTCFAEQAIDYAQRENWAYYQEGQEKEADLSGV